jgi:excinuclease ABC subunit A
MNKIIIKGAREHNLKNVSVEIPKDKFVVFTGVSGSGKSSLAFDTIYAEGQRRYVESLSSYARQFLGVMNKPDVDLIEGLSPAISIDQKSVSNNPRSTVGTITEIYDYLRLLFARIGHPFCDKCGTEISKMSIDEIVDRAIKLFENNTDKIKPTQFSIFSPVVNQKKGEYYGLFENLKSKGYSNIIVDNKPFSLDDEIDLIKTNKHTIKVVIDNISLSTKQLRDADFMKSLRSRLFASIEQSLVLAEGKVVIAYGDKEYLFSEKFSCPNCNISLPEIEPRLFSFNSPIGACPKCKGIGYISKIDPNLVLNYKLSINEGGIMPFAKVFYNITWFSRLLQTFLEDVLINPSLPLSLLSEKQIEMLLYGNKKTYKVSGQNRFGENTTILEEWQGIISQMEMKYSESDSEWWRAEVERFMHSETCDTCKGKRLKPEVLNIKILDKNIWDISELSIDKAFTFIENLPSQINSYEKEISKAIIIEIKNRLNFLVNVGLNYLNLNRNSGSLSGGEAQRIRLASQIGSGLTGVIYVLDEPSIGLHTKDVNALIASLKHLKDLGNTVIIVEHDEETIAAADYVVDFGLHAGKQGGKVIFTGSVADLKKDEKSLTGQYLSKRREIPKYGKKINKNQGNLVLSKCNHNNLKNINVTFPLGNLICISGVSGSGKSSLIVDTLYPALNSYLNGNFKEQTGYFEKIDGYQYLDKVYLVDQSMIGRTPRSNPSTYVGVFDVIRDLFAETSDARTRGYKKGRFSFNVKGGRCEKCQGAGSIKIEMQFLPDVYVKCDVCEGRRYNSETLEIKYKEKTIYDVLNMTVDEASKFFENIPMIRTKLEAMRNVGLGYIELGQPAPTLSGGEAQRIKLAFELAKKETGRTLYILDEPTTGLHLYDIEKLVNTLYKLVDKGNTVIIIEHNLEVIKNCQYVIDLGPEGGDKGGKLVYQGDIPGLKKCKDSYTGHYLK